MSWLSQALGKIPVVGGIINDAGKVVDTVANSAISAIPGGSAVLQGADAIGRAIPLPGAKATNSWSGIFSTAVNQAQTAGGGALQGAQVGAWLAVNPGVAVVVVVLVAIIIFKK